MRSVLLVEQDPEVRYRIGGWLEEAGLDVYLCPGPSAPTYTCVASGGSPCPLVPAADLVLLDLWLASENALTGTTAICPDAPLAEAARLMHREGIKRLPVVDAEERLVGIVSRADLLRVFLRSDDEIRRVIVHDVIDRTLWIDPHTIEVRVHEGVVILQGVAERKSLIPIIVEFVKQVDGVIGVESHLSYEIDDEIHHPGFVTPWGLAATGMRPGR